MASPANAASMRALTRKPCATQMLLQSVVTPGAGVATGSLAVGMPALLAAFGSAVEGAAVANPGQAQARLKSLSNHNGVHMCIPVQTRGAWLCESGQPGRSCTVASAAESGVPGHVTSIKCSAWDFAQHSCCACQFVWSAVHVYALHHCPFI